MSERAGGDGAMAMSERAGGDGAMAVSGDDGTTARRDGVFGGVELGGTKVVCVIGRGPDGIVDSERIGTAEPAGTITAAVAFLRRAVDRGVVLDGIGVGSFGPLELRRGHPRYGSITRTPKLSWQGTDVVGPFAGFGVPVGFDMDVNAAALAEGRWGAARGLRLFAYLTLGTGIGGGTVLDGRPLHGLVHAEMGHVTVRRAAGDDFPGVCPFHGDCLEGLASGPAVAARFGRAAESLTGADRDAAVRLVASYVADGIRSIGYVLAPQRVVLGGGLSAMPGLVGAVRSELAGLLAGYPGLPEHDAPDFVVPAMLGPLAGPAGTLLLAERALAEAAVTATD